jgi:hypothetical protein
VFVGPCGSVLTLMVLHPREALPALLTLPSDIDLGAEGRLRERVHECEKLIQVSKTTKCFFANSKLIWPGVVPRLSDGRLYMMK